ncbi:MAG: PTS sugar transporter subunit IIA [Acidobacteria bacterium]|nr:PTS sugar transporter subunit IIA [Acidobacteriota bacterium]
MVYGLIVTHGALGRELLNAANRIEGPLEGVEAVCLDWDEPVADVHQRIQEALSRVPADAEVIIFTDMFGGTPSNLSISFLQRGKVEIVTGVNLPMVVKFGSQNRTNGNAPLLAKQICEKGARAIRVASNLLAGESDGPEESE